MAQAPHHPSARTLSASRRMFAGEHQKSTAGSKLFRMSTGEPFPFAEHRTCTTLTRLTIDHLPADGAIGRRRKFRKDTDIWQPDDRGDRLYFVERGEIAIFSGDPLARDLLLQKAGPGEPFGEVCLCAEGTGQRNTVARACTDVTVLEIKYDAFLRYLEAHPPALHALVCTFCLRLTDCESQSEILAHRGAGKAGTVAGAARKESGDRQRGAARCAPCEPSRNSSDGRDEPSARVGNPGAFPSPEARGLRARPSTVCEPRCTRWICRVQGVHADRGSIRKAVIDSQDSRLTVRRKGTVSSGWEDDDTVAARASVFGRSQLMAPFRRLGKNPKFPDAPPR